MLQSPCAIAILDLLTRYPDCEMRVQDVCAELDEQWPQAQVAATLETLVQDRLVTQLTDAGVAWFSASIRILPPALLEE